MKSWPRRAAWSFGSCLACLYLLWMCGGVVAAQEASPAASPDVKGAAVHALAGLPLWFERRSESVFLARGQDYLIGLDGARATVALTGSRPIALEFVGGRPGRAEPRHALRGTVNSFGGRDPRQWQIAQPTYDGVTYRDVYPGIDVVYYGNRRQLEFDLLVQPNADLQAVRLRFSGNESPRITPSGSLALGDLELALPTVVQGQRSIPTRYVLLASGDVAIHVEPYDHQQPLTIDPTLIAAGRLGGTGYNQPAAVALDAAGNIYVAGHTFAAAFPVTNPAFAGLQGGQDGFIVKLDPSASSVIYATYLGGSNTDDIWGLAVDASGSAWAVGQTYSQDFPLQSPYQQAFGVPYSAVVVKLGPTGSLLYSTYLTGSGFGAAYGVAVDPAGDAYVTGSATPGFPTTAGVYQRVVQGSFDAFVAKFSPSGGLLWSTVLGGDDVDFARGIALDAFGNAYVTGQTYSSAWPNAPPGGAQASNHGNGDVFIAKLNFDASRLLYFTFLGGSAYDWAAAVVVDRDSGVATVTGSTESRDLPTTATAAQPTHGGGHDGFIARLDAQGAAFLYTTYLGGLRTDWLLGLALGPAGSTYVAGWSHSADFPTTAAIQPGMPNNTTSLFVSADAGASWTPNDGTFPDHVIDLSPDPATSGVLVASGEYGIYRTTDGGSTWQRNSLVGSAVLARSRTNAASIYALVGQATYLSLDGGVTWVFRGSLPACCSGLLVADPLDQAAAYAVVNTTTQAPRIIRTTDSGATWAAISVGLAVNGVVNALTGGPDGALYLGLSGGTFPGGVYKSADRGVSWNPINVGLPVNMTVAPGSLLVARTNPSLVYVTDYFTLYRSADGGATWSSFGFLPGGTNALAISESDATRLFFSAYNSTVAMWFSTNSGASWTPAATVGLAMPNRIAPDPLNASRAYAVASISAAPVVAKIDSTGQLLYSTYLGDYGAANGIASAGNGEAVVVGATWEFPTTAGTLNGNRPIYQNNLDLFVARISDATSACTYEVSPPTSLETWYPHLVHYVVTAPSGCAWSASSDQSWARIVSGSTGVGSGIVYVLADSTAPNTQNAILTIAGQAVTLRQRTGLCGYNVFSPDSLVVPAAGGTLQFNVQVASGCEWTVINSDPVAITFLSSAAGTGNGVMMLSVAPNPGRFTRTFQIRSQQDGLVTITQAGTVGATVVSTITSTPSGAAIGITGIGCIPGSFTTPAHLTWNANTNCTISFETPQTIAGAAYTFISATVNGGAQTSANPLTVNSGSSGPVINAFFTPPCTYTLTPTSQAFTAQGGSGTISVATANTCGWSAGTDSPSWVSLPGFGCTGDVCGGGRGRTGNGTVTIVVQPNATTTARSALILIGNQTFRIDQQGFACTYTVSPTHFSVGSAGGVLNLTVTAPESCSWTSSTPPNYWILTTAAIGTGSKRTTISVVANGGPARTGAVTVAGQTVSVDQAAGTAPPPTTCGGATDVTAKFRIDRSGQTAIDPYLRLIQQNIRVVNTSGTTLNGPFYLVFVGLPTAQVNVAGFPSLTTCFSSQGDQIGLLPPVVFPPGEPGTGWLSYLFNKQNWYDPVSYTPKILMGSPPVR